MKIVVDDKIPFLKGVLEPYAQVVYLPGHTIDSSSIKDAELLITRSITRCNPQLLKGSHIQVIATATIGTDHIDLDYCSKSGIQVISAPGCNAAAVEQYVTSAIVALSEIHRFSFGDITLGIIGVGAVGSRVKNIAEILGVNVLLNDPLREKQEGKGEFVSVEKIQQEADMVSLHVPLSRSGEFPTYQMCTADFFMGFSKPPMFINTSRGEVVNTNDLKYGLRSNVVKSAVLDVYENEPEIDMELLALSTIATPHIAGYSKKGKANGTAMVVQVLSKLFDWGLDNWFPVQTELEQIEINCKGLNNAQALQEIFKKVYPILRDDRGFRNNPGFFERLRREYQFRTDNDAITLNCENANKLLVNMLQGLGFKLSIHH